MLVLAVDSVAVGTLAAALGAVAAFAMLKLGPFVASYLKGHGHPVAAELAGVVVEVEQLLSEGKSYPEALETAIRGPEAADLIDRARAALAKKQA